jgi:AraC-like DNA-binding protein
MQSIIKNPTPKDLTNLALEAGYFDQAHFNKAFKQFTGLTPSSFFKAPPQW